MGSISEFKGIVQTKSQDILPGFLFSFADLSSFDFNGFRESFFHFGDAQS